ncbi:hypothetical protein PNOK_0755200 [Pyrrhoderma noxium]|uniref:Uncharacterized protein n=1 Tax=Pyrrhoderma noxium TaxID=2282107 RepID=A0A286UD66_9AGAM|nr:hypothetical protein PNOK_0755200 [Pyrrhoderma noxium]
MFEYGPDETTPGDKALSDEAFARNVEEHLGLKKNSWSDVAAPKPVILPRTKDSREEQIMFELVMKNLREEVKKLEEEELFDSILQSNLENTSANQDIYSNSVDDILRSMLPKSSAISPDPKDTLARNTKRTAATNHLR